MPRGLLKSGYTLLTLAAVVVLSLGTPNRWSGLAILMGVLLCYFAGFAIVSLVWDQKVEDNPRWTAGLHAVVLSTAMGLCLAFFFWIVSAYVLGDLLAGSLLLVSAAVLGIVRFITHRPTFPVGHHGIPVFVLFLGALLFGLYIAGYNEILIDNQVCFSYRLDWPAHLQSAALLQDGGLPLLSRNGTPEFPFSPPTHIGYFVLLAGFSELFHTSLFTAAKFHFIVGFLLITMAGLCLVDREGTNRVWAVFASLGMLFWGGFLLPISLIQGNLAAVGDPYFRGFVQFLNASGSLYHNGTQLMAVVFLVTGFLALDIFARRRRNSLLALALALFIVSGMCKPSAFITVLPALIIVLVIQREKWTTVAFAMGALLMGMLVYLLPALLVAPGPEVGKNTGGMLDISGIADFDNWALVILGPGIGWLALFLLLRGIRGRLGRSRSWQWHDVALVAFLGAMVFSLLFSETGTRAGHGNQTWTFNALIICLSGLFTVRIIGFLSSLRRENTRRIPIILATALIGLLLGTQYLGGLIYAVNYPRIRIKKVPREQIVALQEARRVTDPGAHILVDPALREFQYLGRAAVACRNRRQVEELMDQYGVIISGRRTRYLERFLRERNWTGQALGSTPYMIWRK